MQSVLGDTLQQTSRHSGSYNISAPFLRHSLSHRYMSSVEDIANEDLLISALCSVVVFICSI